MSSEGGPADQLKALVAKVLKDKPKPKAAAPTQYQEKPSLQNAFLLGGQSAIVGAITAGLRNALSGRNRGFLAPIGLFTAVGATFAMTESVVANQRQTDDAISAASGACAAGFLLGLSTRSLPMAIGTCGMMGGVMGMYKYTNGMGARSSNPAEKKSFFKPSAIVEAVKHE
ncbi:NdufA11 NADH dehydrogenase subunit [Mycena venus]|uniref:NdufA11 NADH dehydrogenase subunit n=1 Tax=Mycena venus TaxID=2733690 RepID=A0A8H6XW83_9AGAR|nr:NdufA11 NADH dehydrogenase subunit [Mycena venus]